MITDSLTTILLATSIILISLKGFKNPLLFEKYLFSPERILAGKEYYRLISSGFFHVDQKHLIFNSITLFLFGESIEKSAGFFPFLILFFTSVLGGNLLSLYIHRHHHYRAAGASGGISGLIIGSVILSPGGKIGSLFLPDMFMIPDYLFALLFFAGSIYAAHYRNDNIRP